MARVKERRTYTKVRRAAAEEETRLRIVEALVGLHAEVGPSRTTVSAVAERAGVERLTVYRHFPDEPSMLRACSALYMSRNPPPPLPRCDGVEPLAAVRKTLTAVYAWYRRNEPMFANILRDAEQMPAVRDASADLFRYVDTLATRLDALFPRPTARRRATLHHALEFRTWHSLARLTPSDRAAATLAASWVAAAS
ncbi:MAG TPA: helix-turn-helix domain-containing protein [Thermoanaerobaculia bacterium]|jgi:AcrR family transcriptional regulator